MRRDRHPERTLGRAGSRRCGAERRRQRNAGETLSTTGYGINLSGVLPAPWAADRDRFRWAWNAGKGIGRYIADLNAEGGQDAFFDEEADDLVPLSVASAYIGALRGLDALSNLAART